MSGKKRHGALDFRPPDKAQSAFGPRQLARVDQMRQHARGFKDGDTSASVIVCSRTFVIEMATVDDFSRCRVRAGNYGSDDGPVTSADGCCHVSIQNDGLATAQAKPQCIG